MQTKRVLCPPEVNTAALCFRVRELRVGVRASYQNNSQDSGKKGPESSILDRS